MTAEGMLIATALVAITIACMAVSLAWIWSTTELLPDTNWSFAVTVAPFLIVVWIVLALEHSA